MNIKRGITNFLFFGTLLILVELFPSAQIAQVDKESHTVAAVKVPVFVDDTEQHGINAPPNDLLQRNVWQNNFRALQETFELDRNAVRLEMIRRVQDENYPRRLRSLAAFVLVTRNDDVGRDYFRQQIDPLTVEGVDTLWLMGYFGVYDGARGADMAWAEDLMITALQDKRTLSRDAICRCNYVEEQKRVEIRELAVEKGNFPQILSKLKSKKALPVMLALVEENPPYYAQNVVAELGKFEDKSVEPVILQILKSHDSRFREAVIAAVDLKMRSAFPVILEHLDHNDEDGGTEYGLNALADAGDLPILRQKLKTLKSQTCGDAVTDLETPE